ncbi:type I-F CRISPR-associated protein Csy1 [Enterobacter asburiae]|uniref:type I-F CRISPR-associated protein Csy1 n=1 Tax=Scandinavium sp. UTDF21-P1B TaxID=3446379 RepID=UPI00349A2E1D
MESVELTGFITDYIAARRQAKLDKFEKEAAKRSAEDDAAITLAAQRQALEEQYRPQNWLTDAARRAGQISLVTHAAKFTHGDSKSSSIYLEVQGDSRYLSSSSLSELTADAVGNAAALDVAKLLQTVVAGDSLLACLKRGDYQPLRALADNDAQLALWVEGFSRALVPNEPASHKLAKQIWFPVDGGYHLLSPLFATSFVQAMHEKMVTIRFSDEAKAIRDAHKNRQWHPQPLVRFRNLAVMNFGGTKPQNISALNSSRGGRVWLLSAQPPVWKQIDKPPTSLRSIFAVRGRFSFEAKMLVSRIIQLHIGTGEVKNRHIRSARDGYVDELIDLLFMHVSALQQEKWQGWTQNCPELPRHQQLWLDPWRGKGDESFRLERQQHDWQTLVANDFARRLNHNLRQKLPDMAWAEHRHWQTRPLFRQRMREMETVIEEVLK